MPLQCVSFLLGVYFYNQHPISKVDVLGIVVYKREREDFFCYGGAFTTKSKYAFIMYINYHMYRCTAIC